MIKRFRVIMAAIGIAIAASLSSATVYALDIPPPPKDTAIADKAGIIDESAEIRISQKLIEYKQKTGNEIAVLTVASLDNEDIAGYSYRVASEWGVGSKSANNGVLLFVAKNDRKVRIEVGRGLEPKLTDLQSNLIIRQRIIPEFKKDNYSKGIEQGVDGIISVIGGERLSGSAESNSPSGNGNPSAWSNLFMIALFPLVYIGSYIARSKSWWAGGIIGAVPGVLTLIFSSIIVGVIVLAAGVGLGLLLDFILSRNYQQRAFSGNDTSWWGSGGGFLGGMGGSGGSGSRFGGFGGGGFGGGGSSGDW